MRFSEAVDSKIRAIVSRTWSGNETLRRCRRNTGKRPKTWMLNSVKLKTELVDGNRDASTVDAMSPALVEREEGNGGARAGEGISSGGLVGAPAFRCGPSGSVRERVRGGREAGELLLGVRLR